MSVDDFQGNGCSCSPDFNFVDCCNDHDLAYLLQATSRKQADQELRSCIIERGRESGFPLTLGFIAWVYYIAVRIFGGSFWNQAADDYRKMHNTRRLSWTLKAAIGLTVFSLLVLAFIGLSKRDNRSND